MGLQSATYENRNDLNDPFSRTTLICRTVIFMKPSTLIALGFILLVIFWVTGGGALLRVFAW